MDLLKNLNPKQQEVVRTIDGPLLVLAGAGSGKTKALIHRIAYMISEENIKPQKILAITFTNKAAKEMEKRAQKLFISKTGSPDMGTFHSVCARILRQEGHFLGFSSSYVIFDEDDSLRLVKQCMKKMEISDQKISPKVVKNHISSAKNELLSPELYAQTAGVMISSEITAIYYEYQKEIQKNNAMDFDDLIYNTVRIFQNHPEVLKKYQDRWPYLLIDEYQDTNQSQYIFAKLLAGEYRNICVVGDDWQSIYGWRGANFRNILNFRRDWPDAKIIKLEQNYRSTKTIISAAQRVIEKNSQRSEKTIWTENPSGSLLNVYEARNENDEGGYVCREALELAASGYKLQDMAVFYRTNAQSRALEEQFLRYRIPYKIIGGVRFYERKEIKDVISWLKVVAGAGDWISFERSLNSPPSGFGKKSFEHLKTISVKNSLGLNDLLENQASLQLLRPAAQESLRRYKQKLKQIKSASEKSLKNALEAAIEISGIRGYLDDGSLENIERIENLKELLSVAEEYENIKANINLTEFLEEIALISDIDNYQEETNGITIMTAHTSKGLEFKIVFIVGLEENIFPHSRSIFEPANLEEERRLFYVALTRAKEKIYLLHCTSRLYFGGIQTNLPSRFLTEIPMELTNLVNTSGDQVHVMTETMEENMAHFTKGEKIHHEHFGIGEIITVDGDELTVEFKNVGQKIISVLYAPIKKV